MRVYWEVAWRSLRRQSTYRAATLAGLFTNTVFGFISAYVITAVLRGRQLGGYDARDGVTFQFLTQGLLMYVSAFGLGIDLAPRIRTGDVTTDLFRPVDFHGYWAATDAGRAVFQLVARGIIPFLVGGLAFDLIVPTGPGRLALFALCLVVALVVSFGLRYLVSALSFWLLDDRGVTNLFVVLTSFCAGLMLPLPLFPDGLRHVVQWLPFAALAQVPADAWLGKPIAASLARAVGWAVVLTIACRVITRIAVKRVVSQGG